jgi:hypothetical protein
MRQSRRRRKKRQQIQTRTLRCNMRRSHSQHGKRRYESDARLTQTKTSPIVCALCAYEGRYWICGRVLRLRKQQTPKNGRRGNDDMNKFAFVAATVLFAGMTTLAFADCDTRKADEDKQASAAEKCEDAFLRRQNDNGVQGNRSVVYDEFYACNAKAGCSANDKHHPRN